MDVTWVDKNKNVIDGVRNIFRDIDAQEAKTAINSKVNKVEGKDLSKNDFNDTYKTILDNLPSGSGVITDFTYTITCDGTTEVFTRTNLLNNQDFQATLWYTDSSDTTIPSGGRRLQTVYGLDATDATIYINISGFNPATRVYTLYTIGRWKAPVASGSSWVDSGWVDSGWVN